MQARLTASPSNTLYLWAPDDLRGAALDAWMARQQETAGVDHVVVYRWAGVTPPDHGEQLRPVGRAKRILQ
ncbi:hypothetical protein JYK14_14065 [Siccirubricoccus sp. KC 17139]|uniref:Uncharacterized protein n=1 Tax=Siccirubricoccus soli TaxID=2899147 RepID=A0ABT1D5T1_9PROT|nr:hypothetical protein [Siccirubricoccus soli]MCO6417282.1 hypothetical protein [Siccirubricoccus soli]MCP2683417.1 hypothetical protein [Siccirubricoccus soli]